ncbi:hypothetical protein [Sphingobacterium endophyticum]|uniref:hypothetical protein n=1 Tax=Sphingobacterium endophyticum TaxID=2546448 RepID=UPI0012E283D1|nr:hypothetical protein [Sphingobacterium endophyticum]
MSHKIPTSFSSGIGSGAIRFPSSQFLENLRAEAISMSRALPIETAEQYIRLSLLEWPDIIDSEVKKFREELKK